MPNKAVVQCAQCGADNEPGHLYCAKCKSKLNLDQISSESFIKSGQHRDFLLQGLQLILLLIIVCFAFALWPVQFEALKISGVEFGKARNKLNQLQQGVTANPVEFSETEINILFNHLLQEDRRRSNFKAGPVSIYDCRVAINPNSLTFNLNYQVGPWMLGPVAVGPFWLTYTVTSQAEKYKEGVRFTALKGTIGHLPLPFIGGKIGKKRLQQIFIPFKNARVFLSRLEIVALQEGSITVAGAK